MRSGLGAGRELWELFDELMHAAAKHVDVVKAFGEEVPRDAHRDLLAVVDADDLGLVSVVFLVKLRLPTRRAPMGTVLQTSYSAAR